MVFLKFSGLIKGRTKKTQRGGRSRVKKTEQKYRVKKHKFTEGEGAINQHTWCLDHHHLRLEQRRSGKGARGRTREEPRTQRKQNQGGKEANVPQLRLRLQNTKTVSRRITENKSKKTKKGATRNKNRGQTSQEPEKNREKGTNISRGNPP
ncbi:hypothetical protein NC653_040813 [Populus alba x Populus x berolinensis]|uniref:Uncharacterized protein n=1 Tax=Populus alba x Populus x berolinensis TaxID=444605 RepID=A0AAD6PNG4_9ROSI|nr:hypothetical protein NC653_040813 [Populus alba x Populus x berolinensis]